MHLPARLQRTGGIQCLPYETSVLSFSDIQNGSSSLPPFAVTVRSLLYCHLHKILFAAFYNHSLTGKIILAKGCLNILNLLSVYGNTALLHISSELPEDRWLRL